MKFFVDEMPTYEGECPFSDWTAYPPIIEKTGDWVCEKDRKVCDLSETECRWMKRLNSSVFPNSCD